jgi:hypothetical protein
MIRNATIAVAIAGLLGLGGCVTETTSSTVGASPMRKIRRVDPAPTSAPINDIALLKGMRPLDTTGNGFPNRLKVSVYLFARPYPVPRFADGTLVFTLRSPVEPREVVAEWRFDPEAMGAARFRDVIGQGYALNLDLDALGMASIPYQSAALRVAFEPAKGVGVQAGAAQSVSYRH